MAILQNLAEAFSSAAGDQGSVQAIEGLKADRKATEHEQLHAQTQSILDDVKRLQDRRAALPPNSPELAEIDKSLTEHQQAFTDLYHPAKNPGNFGKLGGFLRAHLGQRQSQAPPTTPGQAKATMAQLQASAAGTAIPDPAALNPEEKAKAVRISAGLEPRATTPKAEAENWQTVNVKRPDGSEVTLQHNTKSGEWTNLDGTPVPKEQLSGATVASKGVSKPIRAWVKRGGKTVSVLVDPATNKAIPGSENPDIQPPSNMAGRITTGFFHFVDDNNQVHQIQETRTSMPAGSGGAGVPKTAGEAKDRVLGTKSNAPANKANTDYNEAVKLASIADQVSQKPDDAINQKRLAVALERASAGRFTTQALDYIIKAGWGNTLEQWANNPTTGALPTDVMRQLVDGAHQNLEAAKKAKEAAHTTPPPTEPKVLKFNPVSGKLE